MSRILSFRDVVKIIPAYDGSKQDSLKNDLSDVSSRDILEEKKSKVCRICFSAEENPPDEILNSKVDKDLLNDDIYTNPLLMPCGCSGSIAYVHKHCLLRWRISCAGERGIPMRCELCHQAYKRTVLGLSLHGPVHLAVMLLLSSFVIGGQHILHWISQQSVGQSDFLSYMLIGSQKQTSHNLLHLDMAWLAVLSTITAQYLWSFYPRMKSSLNQSFYYSSSIRSIPHKSSFALLPLANNTINWTLILSDSLIWIIEKLSLIPVITLVILLSTFHPVQAIAYLPDLLFKLAGAANFISIILYLRYQRLLTKIMAFSPRMSDKINVLNTQRFQNYLIIYMMVVLLLHVFNYKFSIWTSNYFTLRIVLLSMRTFVETLLWAAYTSGTAICANIVIFLIVDV